MNSSQSAPCSEQRAGEGRRQAEVSQAPAPRADGVAHKLHRSKLNWYPQIPHNARKHPHNLPRLGSRVQLHPDRDKPPKISTPLCMIEVVGASGTVGRPAGGCCRPARLVGAELVPALPSRPQSP